MSNINRSCLDTIVKAKYASKMGTIKGVLWHQGESDTVNKKLAESYESKLHTLINDLRNDLEIADLPFITGNLAEFYGTGKDHNAAQRVKQINQVKKALRDVPTKIPNTGFEESTGCKSIDKHMVYFDRESYIILGERYAQEIFKLSSNQ